MMTATRTYVNRAMQDLLLPGCRRPWTPLICVGCASRGRRCDDRMRDVPGLGTSPVPVKRAVIGLAGMLLPAAAAVAVAVLRKRR